MGEKNLQTLIHKVCRFLKVSRNDVIRTRDLFVPNEALYQAEPHSDIFSCTTKTVLCYISIIKCNCLEKNECFCG